MSDLETPLNAPEPHNPGVSDRAQPSRAHDAGEHALRVRHHRQIQRDAERLKILESEVFEEALQGARDTMRYYSLPDDATVPPEQWVSALGEEQAWFRFRRVKAGQTKASETPIGAKFATAVMTGTLRNRDEQQRAPQLNVAVVRLREVPQVEFPVLVLQDGSRERSR